jgi:hypothetical protein
MRAVMDGEKSHRPAGRLGGIAFILSGTLYLIKSILDLVVGDPPSTGPEILEWQSSHELALAWTSEVLTIKTRMQSVPGVDNRRVGERGSEHWPDDQRAPGVGRSRPTCPPSRPNVIKSDCLLRVRGQDCLKRSGSSRNGESPLRSKTASGD